jgi:hypothetical protein
MTTTRQARASYFSVAVGRYGSSAAHTERPTDRSAAAANEGRDEGSVPFASSTQREAHVKEIRWAPLWRHEIQP